MTYSPDCCGYGVGYPIVLVDSMPYCFTSTFPIIGDGSFDVFDFVSATDDELWVWSFTTDLDFTSITTIKAYFGNPDRFLLGRIALDYHGFVERDFEITYKKQYHGVYSFLPSIGYLEPPEINLPLASGQPRSTNINWKLGFSVSGTMTVYACKLYDNIVGYL